MALNLETLSVALKLDAGNFKSAMTQAQAQLGGFRDRLASAGEALTKFGQRMTGFVTLPLIGAGVAFVNWASDVDESMSAVTQVYGDGADFIIDKSSEASHAVFLSQGEYLEAAATLGVYGKTAGLTGDELATFGDNNIAAAADLASFYNAAGGVPEVLNAIQSGLVGEYEPLRQYGIVLNEAAINEYAWANGIAARGDALTEQEKILARYGLIMESLGPAQGDAQRTANGLANSTRRLQARFKDIGATIGRILLPVAMQLVDLVDDLFDWIEKISPSMLKWVVVIAAVAAAMGPLLIVIGMVLPALGALVGMFGLLLSPIGLVIAAVGLLAYAFRDDIVNAISVVADKISDFIDLWKQFREDGLDPVQSALVALQQLFPALGAVISPLRGMFDSLLDAFNALKAGDYPEVVAKLSEALRNLGSAVKAAFTSIDWGAIGSTLLNGAQAAVNGVIGVLSSIDIPQVGLNILKWLINSAQDVMEAIKGWLGFGPSSGMSGDGTGGAMSGRSVDIGQVGLTILKWLVSTAQDVVEAIKDHIMPVVADLTEWTLNVAQPAVYFVGWNVAEAMLKKMTRTVVRLTEWTMNVEAADVVDVLFDVAGAILKAIKEDPIKVTLAAAAVTLALVGAPIIVLGAIALYIATAFLKAIPDSVLINATVLMFSLINFAVEVIGLIAEVTLAILLELAKAPIAVGGFTVELADIFWDVVGDITQEIVAAILNKIPGGKVVLGGLDIVIGDDGETQASGGNWGEAGAAMGSAAGNVQVYSSVLDGLNRVLEVTKAQFIATNAAMTAATVTSRSATDAFRSWAIGLMDLPPAQKAVVISTELMRRSGNDLEVGFRAMTAVVSAASSTIASTVASNFVTTSNTVRVNTDSMRSVASENASAMKTAVSSSAETMKSNVSMAMTGTQTAVALQSMLMMAAAKAQGLAMVQNAASAASSFRAVFASGAAGAASAVSSAMGSMLAAVRAAAGGMYSAGADAIAGLVAGASSQLGALQDVVNQAISIFRQIPALGNSPWPMMINAGEDAMDGLIGGVGNRRGALQRNITGVIGEFANASPAFGAISDAGAASATQGGLGQRPIQIITLEPGKWKEFLDNAMAGGDFARNAGPELAMYGGKA